MGIDETLEERRTRQAIVIQRTLRTVRSARHAARQVRGARRATAALLIQRRYRQWPGCAASLSLREVRARAARRAAAAARAHGLLLRPGSRFVVTWRLLVVCALALEGAQLVARRSLDDDGGGGAGYAGSWDPRANAAKVRHLLVHPDCLPPTAQSEAARRRAWRRARCKGAGQWFQCAARPPPPPAPPAWCDGWSAMLRRRAALAAAPAVGVAVSVVAAGDIGVSSRRAARAPPLPPGRS